MCGVEGRQLADLGEASRWSEHPAGERVGSVLVLSTEAPAQPPRPSISPAGNTPYCPGGSLPLRTREWPSEMPTSLDELPKPLRPGTGLSEDAGRPSEVVKLGKRHQDSGPRRSGSVAAVNSHLCQTPRGAGGWWARCPVQGTLPHLPAKMATQPQLSGRDVGPGSVGSAPAWSLQGPRARSSRGHAGMWTATQHPWEGPAPGGNADSLVVQERGLSTSECVTGDVGAAPLARQVSERREQACGHQ